MKNDYYWPCVKTVAFDVETTGINRERDRIIMFGLFGMDINRKQISKWAVVDAKTTTGRNPCNLPGVSLYDIKNAKPLETYINDIYNSLHEAIVIIHNAPHDWAFVVNECKRINHPCPLPRQVICTYQLARRLRTSTLPVSLDALCLRLHIPLVVAHNALHDARAAFYLWVVLNNLTIYTKQWNYEPHCTFAYCSKYFPPRNFDYLPAYFCNKLPFPREV